MSVKSSKNKKKIYITLSLSKRLMLISSLLRIFSCQSSQMSSISSVIVIVIHTFL